MEALKQKIRRGLVLTQVPVGYVRTEDEGMEKTPDRQIQEAIAGIFRKFRELGSVRQVLLWYREEKLPIPALSRESGHRKVVGRSQFIRASSGIFYKIPLTPALSYGEERRHGHPSLMDAPARHAATYSRRSSGKLRSRTTMKSSITWDEYMRNQQQIRTNAGWNARMGEPNGATKNGPALLAGLLRCGRCGRALQVSYTMDNGWVLCHAIGATEIAGDRWFAAASPSREGESINQSPSKFWKPFVPLACRQHLTHSIAASTRPMRSAARLNSPLRRRGMRPTVLNGSTRRRNQRTDLSQGSLRSVGTQHSAMSLT